MYCSVTGQPPEEPVVSKKTGHLYEKRIIEKYIDTNGKCPVTGEDLSKDDLMAVKTSSTVKPRPVVASSIPGMLTMFQNEWDALMLETHQLKKQLDTVRQELSHTLYQHDAACRVIARLTAQLDAARGQLQNAGVPAAADTSAAGGNGNYVSAFEAKSATLIKGRKKRAVSETQAKAGDISGYKAASSHPVHKSNKPGILCVDVHPTKDNMVATGGVDTSVVLFDRSTGKVASTLSGHTKSVLDVKFHPSEPIVVSASADKTARVWIAGEKGYKAEHILKTHTADVVNVALHPTGQHFATASLDDSWAIHDLARGECLHHAKAKASDNHKGYKSMAIHPDGLIMATGCVNNIVKAWDMRTNDNIANFTHSAAVNAVSFSENGYHMATCEDHKVRVWDLRKDQKILHQFAVDEGTAQGVAFDRSGLFLGVAAADVRVFAAKGWDLVKTWSDHSANVTDVAFGADAKYLASTSMDRTLKFYA
eukprot:GFYU01008857.1.p1 GENE.GFYU01008857.1~~GFYU01008857.1.p1  ORF type:complete len:496 (-),score=167.73 GFYU01008857.1:412-1851(-)